MQVVSGLDEVWQSSCLSWDEMLSDKVPEPGFIVENIIPRKGVTLITGEGGIGKSFLLIELAYSVASGQPFLGRFSTVQGPVLYIDLENDNIVITQRVKKATAHALHPATSPSQSVEIFPRFDLNSENLSLLSHKLR